MIITNILLCGILIAVIRCINKIENIVDELKFISNKLTWVNDDLVGIKNRSRDIFDTIDYIKRKLKKLQYGRKKSTKCDKGQ